MRLLIIFASILLKSSFPRGGGWRATGQFHPFWHVRGNRSSTLLARAPRSDHGPPFKVSLSAAVRSLSPEARNEEFFHAIPTSVCCAASCRLRPEPSHTSVGQIQMAASSLRPLNLNATFPVTASLSPSERRWPLPPWTPLRFASLSGATRCTSCLVAS